MRFAISAEIEVVETDERGQQWHGSYGLPTFYVEAGNPDNARTIAMQVIGHDRPNMVTAHFEPEEVQFDLGLDVCPWCSHPASDHEGWELLGDPDGAPHCMSCHLPCDEEQYPNA